MKKRNGILNVLVVLAFLLVGMPIKPAKADSFIIVNTNLDDATAGDGFCTLREAINNANENLDTTSNDCVEGSGADTITFDSSLSGGTIILGNNLPFIIGDLTVDGSTLGSQLTLNGDNAYRSGLYIQNGVTVAVQNLTFINGYGWGGAIFSNGTLTVTNSIFSSNHGNFGNGGAIISGGPGMLTVNNSTFSGNSTVSNGGAIASGGTLTLTNSTLRNNSSVLGGGLFNEGPASVSNSTFSGNTALGQVNSPIEGLGGGVYNIGTLTLNNVTISSNSATNDGGGVFNHNNGTLSYSNTIIANSTSGGDCWTGATPLGINTNNLVEDGSCSASLSGDPKLGALADNDGSTQTLALLSGSPALNTGDDTTCLAIDQRSVTRPKRGHCDIGSYEYEGTFAPSVDSFTTPSAQLGGQVPITTLTASDDIAVTGYMVTESATPPSPNDAGWQASAPHQYTITRQGDYFTEGTHTLYPWVKDMDGNVSTVYSSPATVDVTFISPYIMNITRKTPTDEITNADTLVLLVWFYGQVKNVDSSDFVVTGGTTATVTGVSRGVVSAIVTISGGDLASFNGTVGLDISPSQDIVSSNNGKHLVASVPNPNQTYTVDNTAPTVVSIVRASANPTSASTVDFTVTFSESVTGVDAHDFSLTGSSLSQAVVGGTGSVYTVAVSTRPGNSTIRLDLVDNDTISDGANKLAGNGTENGSFNSVEAYTIVKNPIATPRLTTPKQNSITNNPFPTFKWATISNALSYEIFIATDSTFNNVILTESVASPTFTPSTSIPDGRYYWRVRAYNLASLPGRLSNVQSFTIDTTAPSIPNHILPIDNATITKTPVFRWMAVTGAALYQFEYDNDADFSSPLFSATTRVNFRKPPTMPNGSYYWHVRAKDAAGNWSLWSTPFTVTISK